MVGIIVSLVYGFLGFFLSTALVLWLLYKWLVVDMHHPRILKMRDTRGVVRHYFCGIMQQFYMKRGVLYPHPGDEIVKVDENAEINKSLKKYKILEKLEPHPTEKLKVVDCYMLHRHLRLYREVTNFSGHHTQVQPCFMFVYFNKPIVAIGASFAARTRLLGSIHTKQEITVYQDLRPLLTGRFSLSVRGTEYRKTTRGVEGDLSEFVYDEHDVLVWEGKSQGLSLNNTYKPNKTPVKNVTPFEVYREEPVVSYMDTGYKYAEASIDWQPQHLNGWVARMAGFKKPVAHGMWVAAMAVEVITRNESCFEQTYPLNIEFVFRSPMELGTTALMRYDKPKGISSMTQMRMVDSKTERPILEGRIYVGPKEKDSITRTQLRS